jgi:pantetheine-phosphate adenylyltransferase
MTRSAIYPGTFDPITNGHIDIIHRGLFLFDRLVVAIVRKPEKAPLFSAEERFEMAQAVLSNTPGSEVTVFDGLLINFSRKQDCHVIVRGLRAISDFEYELQIALTNRAMDPKIETVFLLPGEKNIYLASRMVKEIASYGGPVGNFVTPIVERRLRDKFPTPPASGTIKGSP